MKTSFFPAEWYNQSCVQLTWPHSETDWADNLKAVSQCFASIASAVAEREKVLIVCRSRQEVLPYLANCPPENLILSEIQTNDTWARDHGGITVYENGRPVILDFKFNGWGLKFPASLDNLITSSLFEKGVFAPPVQYNNCLDFVLEGGSIESDGAGTILTTSECLLSKNRNGAFKRDDIDSILRKRLHASRVLFLDSGFLEGDDTDSHIDTLARFVSEDTIAYVECTDKGDVHYDALAKMKEQLETFTTAGGRPYRLVALPMAEAAYDSGHRLPATYANFLIINGAVLMPLYKTPADDLAADVLSSLFPDRDIAGIDCRALIKQHGSLHCVTMQYPEGVLP